MEVFIVFGSITAVILGTAWFHHDERVRLIGQGIDPNGPVAPKAGTGSRAFFFGLIALAAGLAAVTSSLILWDIDSHTIHIAVPGIFIGAASILYWRITAGDREYARTLVERSFGGK